MSEVKEETNTCSYEERSRCGCENLSWRYLNDKWVDDYCALVSKIHLLTPTAFLSRCDWDCLRKDWDILRCLRQVMFDPFRRDFLPNCIRLWRRLVAARRQNIPKWRRIQTKLSRFVISFEVALPLISSDRSQKTMGRNKVCIINLFHLWSSYDMVNRKVDAVFLPQMIGQTSSRRLTWLTSGSSPITGRKTSSPKRNGSHFWKLYAVICQHLSAYPAVDSVYMKCWLVGDRAYRRQNG